MIKNRVNRLFVIKNDLIKSQKLIRKIHFVNVQKAFITDLV